MSYRVALESVRDYIIDNMTGFTLDNCSIGDEGIFSYIQSDSVGAKKAVLLSPEPFSPESRREFMGASVFWTVGVNAFFMIVDDDIAVPLMAAVDFADALMLGITQNPSLDESVYSVKLQSGGPLMTYARANYYYFLMPMVLSVADNIS